MIADVWGAVEAGGEAPPVLARMAVPFMDLARQNARYRDAFAAALDRVLSSSTCILGSEVAAFEREFAEFCGASFCVGVASGLDALTLTLRAWGVGPGDEVIVPSNTYIATWLAVSACGATPVPVEPDRRTMNLDPGRLELAITGRTKAIVPVHLYGLPAALAPIRAIARRYGLMVLEDASQAHGAIHEGRRIGHAGEGASSSAVAFSLYPTKPLGALGDAGCVTTDDPVLARTLALLRNYGSAVKYVNEMQGGNSRLDELQAAFLRIKLADLDTDIAERARLAARYEAALSNLPVVLPVGVGSAWHVYVIRVRDRDRVAARLADDGVGTLIHYPIPPHKQPAYGELRYLDLPIAEQMADEVLSLPLWAGMTDAQQDTVIASLRASVLS